MIRGTNRIFVIAPHRMTAGCGYAFQRDEAQRLNDERAFNPLNEAWFAQCFGEVVHAAASKPYTSCTVTLPSQAVAIASALDRVGVTSPLAMRVTVETATPASFAMITAKPRFVLR